MDTKQNEWESILVAGPPDRQFMTPWGWAVGALAVAAVVAVICAAIWTVAPNDVVPSGGSFAGPETAPPAVESSTPSAAAVANGRTLYLWDPNTGSVRNVFSSLERPGDGEFSPVDERVVYEHQAPDGDSQIYLLRPDGTERRLTNLPRGAFDPTWSPDGKEIAFAASMGAGEDADIFIMDANGDHVERVAGTAGNDVDPDWSPDGSRIVFTGQQHDNRGGIWLAPVRTGMVTRLTPSPGREQRLLGAMDPSWSPHGRWIAFSRYWVGNTLNGMTYSAELWLMRPDGAREHRISKPDGDRVKENPSWSPDGRLIAFEHHNFAGGNNRLLIINLETGRERSVLESGDPASWSDAAPSWHQQGILMSLQNGAPEPKPGRAPVPFHVEVPGIDATITLTRSSCALDIHGPIHPGRLKLELVNDWRRGAGFSISRLSPTQTLNQLRAEPSGPTRLVHPSASKVWSRAARSASGRWAVECYKDGDTSPVAFSTAYHDLAGPIKVG